MTPPPKSYADAGVDIEAGERAVDLFKERLRATHRAEVVGGIGGFAGLFSLNRSKYRRSGPMLVASTDGVGTKVMIAQQLGIHHTVGIDLVAMSANDVAVQGAEPLFFLDYIVTGKVVPETIDLIVAGVVEGCRQAGCALLGGEIAEHPGHMVDDSYDLAGFCVGAVEEGKLLTGASMIPGDVVIGLNSSGLHSNGFSLVRKVMNDNVLALEDRPEEFHQTLGEELLTPTIIYWDAVAALQAENLARGFAHITGGGLASNVSRMIPPGSHAIIEKQSWQVPNVFHFLMAEGVPELEMFRTFNMGIGMVAVVVGDKRERALEVLADAGYAAQQIGVIEAAADGSPAVTLH